MPIPQLEFPLIHEGKVRRLYDTGSADTMLMVATDQISSFDHILESEVPDKGIILTQLSLWWFDQLKDLVPHHVVSTDVPDAVRGRGLMVQRLRMVPVECVARGYLTGSVWAEYQQSQTVCGIELPAGLHDGDRLPAPIFTPAIKAAVGEHDENVDFETMCASIPAELGGRETGEKLRDFTLALYSRAEEIARERGIILADTKFEFGLDESDQIVLADEVLTPDSSRFWDAAQYAPGSSIPSFDKQYVRDWLQHDSGWDKSSDTPPPALPADVIDATRARYVEAYERLTGETFNPAQTR